MRVLRVRSASINIRLHAGDMTTLGAHARGLANFERRLCRPRKSGVDIAYSRR